VKFARSLKGRLTIIVAIAIVVTGTVVLLFTYFMARSVLREQVFKSMDGVASRTVAEVQLALREASPVLDTLAENPQLLADIEAFTAANPDRQAIAADVAALISPDAAASSSMKGILVTSVGGTVIATVKGPVAGTDLKNADPQVLSGLKPGRPVLTFNVGSDGLTIVKVFPVSSLSTNKVVGAVVSNTASPVLENELSNTSGLGEGGRILLSDMFAGKISVAYFLSNGAVGTNTVGKVIRLPLNSEAAPAKAARGEKGEEESKGMFGQEVVSSYNFVPEADWGVTATTDSSDAFAPINRLRNVSILVILVLLVGGCALAYMIARTISRPLKDLQEGVKAIAAGDLTTRVMISDGVEVTALADEFNSMAGRLKDLYDNLEKKVQERTIELQYANNRLHELDELKSEFVSMASHELRSPMASMKMGVSTVLREMIGPLNEDQKLMLGIAERNIDRLTTLTSELLDLTKIEAGQLDIVPAAVDLVSLAAEVVEADTLLAQHEGVALALAAPDEPVMVDCDHDRIYQVIQNLVGNALTFTEEGGVTVSVAKESAEMARVCVKDTGLGIPADALQTIFDKWSRAHAETRSEKRGTGLGLAISKGIVEAHGGEITLESEAGKGTTVCFTLPLRGTDE